MEAVYGMRKTKMITDATIFRALLSKRWPKNSGMVEEERCWVMTRVRRPRTTQARRLPMMALPRPIQVEAMPYFQPNCPA